MPSTGPFDRQLEWAVRKDVFIPSMQELHAMFWVVAGKTLSGIPLTPEERAWFDNYFEDVTPPPTWGEGDGSDDDL